MQLAFQSGLHDNSGNLGFRELIVKIHFGTLMDLVSINCVPKGRLALLMVKWIEDRVQSRFRFVNLVQIVRG